ncbi:MAG: FAD-dependent oxidoreductase [Thermodesulfobacteriota bacterium]|nr:FAD-dependent oxidoreductase [Thermodesulfobacteriota bacterium]
MNIQKLIIVGGVAGGASAAAKARRCSEEVEIIMYEKGPDISYANCGLPYYLSGIIKQRDDLLISTADFFRSRFNVDARPRHEVISINREARRVIVKKLDTGQIKEEDYDRLILAPGSHAIMPPLQGMDLPFVYTLKTLEDTDRIFNFIRTRNPCSAVVVGGGLIGSEAMENLALRGIKTTVVEFAPQILIFLDWEMAEIVRRHARDKGVTFHLSEGLKMVKQQEGRNLVITDRDREIPTDLVLVAVGVRPNVDLAEKAGLEIGPTGGLKVNEYMQTKDKNIYAAGDCIETMNLITGKPVLTPMGSAANKQGRAAGANALGRQIKVKGFTGTVIVKIFDLTVAKSGLSEKEAMDAGFNTLVTYLHPGNHAGYYPGSKPLQMKLVADRDNGRLLGSQIIGHEGVDKRIDVIATAIYNRMNLEDLIHLDLAYAPPYSAARDPVVVAGAVGQNYFQGDWNPITPYELHERMQEEEALTLLDVRTLQEVEETGVLPGAKHVPIDDLRSRIEELDPQNETVIYCAQGLRSYVGNRILTLNGFRSVRTLTGGTEDWLYEMEPKK